MPTEPRRRPAGRAISIAIIDSGVHAMHPHVDGVAGGVGIDARGQVSDDYVDRIGHGTAVTAAIKEKAPAAECYAVRIFGNRLAAPASTLIRAMEWAIDARVHVINLSLGTVNRAHEPAFASVVARALAAGVAIVAARDDDGVAWLPGCLRGVVQVQVDWTCPRHDLRVVRTGDDVIFRASGFARPVPGVDPRRNLHGVSFAVANVSGFLACALSARIDRDRPDPVTCLERWAGLRRRNADECAVQPPLTIAPSCPALLTARCESRDKRKSRLADPLSSAAGPSYVPVSATNDIPNSQLPGRATDDLRLTDDL